MFTGIVEEIGEVISIDKNERSSLLKIIANKILEDTNIGDSIATNGVCLIITTKGKDYFTAYVIGESLRKSNLGNLKKSSKVNLERAMNVNGRFNGHIVTGNIDSTGEIISFKDEGEAIWVEIKVSYELSKYIVCKGSTAIDGISLTIAEVKGETFKVSVIPHSQEETTLTKRKIGDLVNIGYDPIGKYVEKLLEFNKENQKKKSILTEEFLTINGFI